MGEVRVFLEKKCGAMRRGLRLAKKEVVDGDYVSVRETGS